MSADAIRQAADVIESALADVVEQLSRVSDGAGMVETALAEALDRMEQRSAIDIAPLVQALNNLRPVVNVTVPPVPAPVVQMMPAPAGSWEIVRPGSHDHRDVVVATIRRVS